MTEATPILHPLHLMIMGSGRHGKGTFCDIAFKYFGLTSLGSSWFACQTFLFDKLKDRFGYTSVEECFNDRHRDDAMRQLWYQEILAYNTPDLTRLGAGIYAQADFYEGVRDDKEYAALREAGFIDLAIWIDASERMPAEPSTSIKVTADDADIVITNNGTPEAFERKVVRLLRVLYPHLPLLVPMDGID